MDDRPIGVFDSGVGGLTVVAALREALPHESIIYLGDTARLPYGTKSPETVRRYAVQVASFLAARGVKMLVVACNTASAVALDEVRARVPDVTVVGVVEPGAAAAVSATKTGKVLVIGTDGTISGGAYERAIGALDPKVQVFGQACPLFVALAEDGWTKGEVPQAVARRYLAPVLKEEPDTLVLGCTHFPVLRETISSVAGPLVRLVDSAGTTAAAVVEALFASKRGASDERTGKVAFLATDGPQRFARVGSIFLGHELAPEIVELVDL